MSADITAQELIEHLGLVPHPEEGGFYRETWRSQETIPAETLPAVYRQASQQAGRGRCYGTAIYYLLTPETFSHMHVLNSDEIFHFYLGDPVEMLLLPQQACTEALEPQVVTLGQDILAGQQVQVRVPAQCWQGARLKSGGRFALLGCTVAPGFEFADYSHGSRDELVAEWPAYQQRITDLTAGQSKSRVD